MGLSIKNPEAERLIRELAAKTGMGQTEALTIAVRDALDRVDAESKRKQRLARVLAVSDRMAPLLKGFDMDAALYGEGGLYDRETGLPK
jgi:antitoxin VapB